MTIEHIAAQNPEGIRLDDFFLGMIGNLILVSEELNNRLANKSFKEKKLILAENKYPMDEILMAAENMDEGTILQRTELIAKKAYEDLWKI
jgi:hypothetical protein